MPHVSSDVKQQIAEQFLASELLKFGEFELKSGITSPFYIDLRKVQSHPTAFQTIVKAYSEMLADEDESVLLAGVPEAATPLAAAVGYELGRPLVQPRKVVKDHGTKSAIEGDFQPGDEVILLDDLITKGDSKLEAIEQVEQAGLKVEKLIVLVDRQQGGMETVQEAGYEIEAALTITELINILAKLDKVTPEQKQKVLDFVEGSKSN